MSRICGLLVMLGAALTCAGAEQDVAGERAAQFESYAAHVAAAAAHLRLGETAATRRWLEAAPAKFRGWEWNYLHAQLDHAVNAYELGADPYALALRPGGDEVAVACDDGKVRIVNCANGAPVRELVGHEAAVYGVTCSPDGKRIASASHDSTVRVWDADSGKELLVYRGHHYPIGAVAFSPDGAMMASATYVYVKNEAGKVVGVDGEVHLWDAQTGQRIRLLPAGHKPISSIAFSQDGKRLAIGSWNGDTYVWDLPDGDDAGRMLTVPDEGIYTAINDISFSPDGALLAAGAKDRTARVWNTTTGELVATLRGHAGWINGLAFSPDGRRIATASADDTLRVWDAATWQSSVTLRGHGKAAQDIAWSPDGGELYSVGTDRSLRVWDAARQDLEGLRMNYGASGTYSAAFSPDGKRIATAVSAEAGSICLWDAATGAKVEEWPAHDKASCHMLAYSRDGQRLVSCSWDATARLWDPNSRALLRTFKHDVGVFHCAISPDGNYVATAPRNKDALLWDAEKGTVIATLTDHVGAVQSVEFSPDGKTLVTGGADGTVRTWEIPTGAARAALAGHKGAVKTTMFSPDGKYIVSGGEDGTVRLWDAQAGAAVRMLLDGDEAIDRVAFAPDGKRVAAAGEVVRILDVAHGGELVSLNLLADGVYHLSFSPDGRRLAMCCGNGTLAVAETTPFCERRKSASALSASE